MIDLFKLCKENLPIGFQDGEQQLSVFQHKSPDAKERGVDSDLKKKHNKTKQKTQTPQKFCLVIFFPSPLLLSFSAFAFCLAL